MSTAMAETLKRSRRPRRRFDDDFKAQAVRLVLDEGKSVGAAARDLDLTETALREWVHRARADRTHGRSGLTTAEREELAQLRKENRQLRLEREILKMYGLSLRCKGVRDPMVKAACVNVSGLLVEPQLLALMESARTDPHKAFGHRHRFFSQAGGAPVDGSPSGRDTSQCEDGFVLRDRRRVGFVHLLAGQHLPADPDHLVRERDDRDIAVATPLDFAEPLTDR